MCCISGTLFAQSTGLLEKKITFANRSIRFDSLLQTITRQSGIKFSYNSRKMNTSYRLRLQATSSTVKLVLEELRKTTGVQYTLIENHIILNIEKSTLQKPASESLPAKNVQPDRSITPAVKSSPDTIALHEPVGPKDSITTPGVILEKKETLSDSINTTTYAQKLVDASVRPGSVSSEIKSSVTPAQPVAKTKPPVQPTRSSFLDIGISTEETLFMGATLQGGLPKFFGSVSVKSNGSSTIFLYGLGTSMNVKKKTRVLFTAHIGPYKKDFTSNMFTPADTASGISDTTVQHRITVKGVLARLTIGVEWKPKPQGNWKLYVGLNVNALQSRYAIDGRNSGLGTLNLQDAERKFSAVYPPYTLTNSYQGNLFVTTKTWIGVELGIRYTINFK